MRSVLLLLLAAAAAGCVHTDIGVNGRSSAVSGGASVQVNAGRGVAAALVVGAVIAATVNDLGDWESAPQMDPTRTVSEQDCSKPVAGGGNLRCR